MALFNSLYVKMDLSTHNDMCINGMKRKPAPQTIPHNIVMKKTTDYR